jgi:GNAT superfamily N-acetyltransferase
MSLDKELRKRYPVIQQNYVNKNVVKEDASVILCYENRKCMGCGCFRNTNEEKVVELKRMYVIDDERGKGIGKGILKELEKWAKEKGNGQIILETGKLQIEAIEMYKKYDYGIIENYGYYKGNTNSICMKKEIWLFSFSREI